jgi:putative transposase
MPERRIPLVDGLYYHIYNRGINRERIFFCQDNWEYFIRQISKYFLPDLVEILVYCLMPTHYHFLVQLHTNNFPFAVMQPFSLSYTKAVNLQQNRVGSLFQGRFKSVLVDSSAYLLQLSRYIHLNPVRANLVKKPADWVFSSYRDYIGMRNGKIPRKEMVMASFQKPMDYQEFVEDLNVPDDKDISHLMFD